jgi:hypothetical protein
MFDQDGSERQLLTHLFTPSRLYCSHNCIAGAGSNTPNQHSSFVREGRVTEEKSDGARRRQRTPELTATFQTENFDHFTVGDSEHPCSAEEQTPQVVFRSRKRDDREWRMLVRQRGREGRMERASATERRTAGQRREHVGRPIAPAAKVQQDRSQRIAKVLAGSAMVARSVPLSLSDALSALCAGSYHLSHDAAGEAQHGKLHMDAPLCKL